MTGRQGTGNSQLNRGFQAPKNLEKDKGRVAHHLQAQDDPLFFDNIWKKKGCEPTIMLLLLGFSLPLTFPIGDFPRLASTGGLMLAVAVSNLRIVTV